MKPIQMAGPWITDLEKKTVADMMDIGWDNYDYVEKFEPAFAKWHGRKYCLMTPCCTHAIHLLLLALGIKKGDEVIVPECTWTATAAPVTYQTATPVFADIDPNNWCLDPTSVKKKITDKTKAIIVVDLYGNMPDMDALETISKEYDIPLIEDAAEALGSTYKGARAGKFGVGGVHSFHRTKTIATGEGGVLLLDDDELFERAKFLRDHGRSSEIAYYTLEATPKYMPSNLQGSMAWAQFQRIDELVNRKRYFLHRYKENLKDIPDLQFNIETDDIVNGVWATTMVFGKSHKMKKLDSIAKLAELDVPARPFFYPLSSLPAYEGYGTGSIEENPNAYDVSERGITLACDYNLTDEQIDFICDGIRTILEK
jgi:perosamine synthetase